ncbi:sialidase-4-like [Rhinoraja longicauda]
MLSRQLPAKAVLFEKKEDGTTYRIPALLHLPDSGTLLAFAEKRSSPDDVDTKVLVVRRGELSGNQVKWEPMEVVRSAQLKGHRSMNPCPVYECSTDTIFLFFTAIWDKVKEEQQRQTGVNAARFCCVSSSDQGRSWSAARDLTKPTLDCCLQDWATFALGPGHGIQLGCGRLLLPAYAYFIDAKESDSKTSPHSFAFYSDDKGKSWQAGKLLSVPPTVECQLVWLDQGPGQAQGTVYCNARTPKYYRAQALSLNRGAAFQEGQLVCKLPESPPKGCHGSVVGFPSLGLVPGLAQGSGTSEVPPTVPAPTWALFCHPACPESRKDLGLYLSVSPPDPEAWTEPWVINYGHSAYSDLAYVEPGASPAAFACLYECGTKTPYDTITFSLVTVKEVLENIPHLPGGGSSK